MLWLECSAVFARGGQWYRTFHYLLLGGNFKMFPELLYFWQIQNHTVISYISFKTVPLRLIFSQQSCSGFRSSGKWCSVIGWMGSQVLKTHSACLTAWHLMMMAWCSFEALESQSPDTASHPRRAEFCNYATIILSVINTFLSYFFSVLPPSDFKYKITDSLLIRIWHLGIEPIT
jgi:hypothetical protein